MFDDLLDIFERECRRPGERRGGLRGLLGRVVGDDHDDRRYATERHRPAPSRRDDRHGGSDDGTYRGMRRHHSRRDAFDWDD